MTALWKSDDELFGLVRRELFTCVVGDVMDKMQLLHQFLPPQIQPLHAEMVIIGRAMTVLSTDVFAEKVSGSANALMAKPFGLMLEALDDLRRHEIYVNTGSSPRNALWGELMSTRASKLGAAGAVLNGYVRDTKSILKMSFPTFGFGSYGQDWRRVTRWWIFACRSKSAVCGCVREISCSETSTEFAWFLPRPRKKCSPSRWRRRVARSW